MQVHRWYSEGDQPGLCYGRRGEPDSGEGICVVKVRKKANARQHCANMMSSVILNPVNQHAMLMRSRRHVAVYTYCLQAGNTFGVVTYTYPNVSAKVIPAFVKVVTANV